MELRGWEHCVMFNGRKNENNSTANDSMKNRFMMNLYLHWKIKLRSRKTAKQSLYLKFMLVIVSRGFTVRLEMAGIYDGLSLSRTNRKNLERFYLLPPSRFAVIDDHSIYMEISVLIVKDVGEYSSSIPFAIACLKFRSISWEFEVLNGINFMITKQFSIKCRK